MVGKEEERAADYTQGFEEVEEVKVSHVEANSKNGKSWFTYFDLTFKTTAGLLKALEENPLLRINYPVWITPKKKLDFLSSPATKNDRSIIIIKAIIDKLHSYTREEIEGFFKQLLSWLASLPPQKKLVGSDIHAKLLSFIIRPSTPNGNSQIAEPPQNLHFPQLCVSDTSRPSRWGPVDAQRASPPPTDIQEQLSVLAAKVESLSAVVESQTNTIKELTSKITLLANTTSRSPYQRSPRSRTPKRKYSLSIKRKSQIISPSNRAKRARSVSVSHVMAPISDEAPATAEVQPHLSPTRDSVLNECVETPPATATAHPPTSLPQSESNPAESTPVEQQAAQSSPTPEAKPQDTEIPERIYHSYFLGNPNLKPGGTYIRVPGKGYTLADPQPTPQPQQKVPFNRKGRKANRNARKKPPNQAALDEEELRDRQEHMFSKKFDKQAAKINQDSERLRERINKGLSPFEGPSEYVVEKERNENESFRLRLQEGDDVVHDLDDVVEEGDESVDDLYDEEEG